MPRDPRLSDFLIRFEDAVAAGRPIPPEVICADAPELLNEFLALLKDMGQINAALKDQSTTDMQPRPVPTQIDAGRFAILEYVDAGGMGLVYTATDTEVGRIVALKTTQDWATKDDLAKNRFVSEAEITAHLEHPGIVPVYGVGSDTSGRPFYAMRFISRDSLRTSIEHFHKLPLNDPTRNTAFRSLLKAFATICETVAYAHDRGVIHRDIKPGNVMLGPYGETLLVDWGLAKRLNATDPTPDKDDPLLSLKNGQLPSIAGVAKGTPAFMSPEQANGDVEKIGPASDLFSLGATLYTLLTGKPPYQGAQALSLAQKGSYLRPRMVQGEVPKALEAVCLKAMAIQPTDRYSNAKEIAQDIERYLADEPVSAWREPFTMRARRWSKRHRTLLVSGALTLVVATAISIISSIMIAGKNEKLKTANDNLSIALDANTEELYLASIGLAHRQWGAGDLRGVEDRLALCPESKRGWEWFYLDRLTKSHIRKLEIPIGGDRITLSQDGQTLAILDNFSGAIEICNLKTGARTPVTGVRFNGPTLALSPDGKLFAGRGGNGELEHMLIVWDIQTNRKLWQIAIGGAGAAVFSPDGKTLAAQGESFGNVVLFDSRTGEITGRLEEPGKFKVKAIQMAFNPDGSRIALADWNAPTGIWDIKTGKRVLEIPTGCRDIRYSPDGKQILTSKPDGQSAAEMIMAVTERPQPLPDQPDACIWNAETGKLLFELKGHTGPISEVVYSPDSKRVATASWDQSARVWDAKTGRLLRTIRGHKSAVTGVVFESDERLITIGADNRIKTWDLSADQDATIINIPPRAGGATAIAISHDASVVATATGKRDLFEMRDCDIYVWDTHTSKELAKFSFEKREVKSLAISPDGKYLVALASLLFSGEVHVWEIRTGRKVFATEVDSGIALVNFTRDGKHIGVATATRAMVWNFETGEKFHEIKGEWFVWIAPAPDSDNLLLGDSSGRVHSWKWKEKETPIFEAPKNSYRPIGTLGTVAAFSLDGKWLAYGFESSKPTLSEIASIQEKERKYKTLEGHTLQVKDVTFTPDGTRIATASLDGTVKLWNTRTGREVITFRMSQPFASLVTFSGDGHTMVATTFSLSPKTPSQIVLWKTR